jgi:hypothetical protein
MTSQSAFWSYFNDTAADKLWYREKTFRKTFEHLDRISGPVCIVETGCARLADNWGGDGQSTVMFDKYISARDDGSTCYSVDISPESVAACRAIVSDRVQLHQDDSVRFLTQLNADFCREGKTIDCLYLDSFDLDLVYWQPSAVHHLKELCAAIRCLRKDTLVVVDDCPLAADIASMDGGKVVFSAPPTPGGKGRLVAEYARSAGAKLEFAQYQAGWTGF